jgi:gluconolactonase
VTGGTTGSGGTKPTGGATGSGGVTATGGTSSTGGATGSGGAKPTGGATGSGGATITGGASSSGGATGTGGTSSTGGASATGGMTGTGGGSGTSRKGGACQAGVQYSAPVLTGTPKLISKPSGGSSGTYEGPVWLSSNSVLLFSDVTFTTPVNPAQMLKLTPPTTVATYLADSGTNGMAVDGNDVVFACSHKVQGIVKLDYAGATLTTVVSNYGGKKFNSPNDIVIRSDGTIYFTDPDYQLGNRTSETGKKAIYRVSPSGTVSVVDDTFNEPNGITLSPDETILYVDDYAANVVRTFAVAADGSTSGRKDFVSVTSPDGFGMDCLGNLYVASGSPGTMEVYSPSGGKLGSVTVAASISNMAFGGADGKTLYITAGKALYSLDMNLPGYYY